MKTKYLIGIGLVFATAVILFLLSTFKPQAKSRPTAQESSVRIEAIQVKPQSYQITISSRGLVKAKTESALAAQVAGNVVEISDAFRLGGRFDKGEQLLQIDPRDYEAALKLAEASERKAELAYQEEQAKAKQAEKDWKRLGNSQKAPDLVLRLPQLAAAQASLDSAQQQVVKARLDLERTQIVAPYAGVVLEQKVDLGHYVNKGSSLGRIANHNELEVVLPVSASWRPFLSQNETLSVSIHSTINGEQQTWPGVIVRQGGEIDTQSRQIKLIATILPNPHSQWQLLAGDYVTAEIDAQEIHGVFVLPRQALVEDKYIWILRDGRIYKQDVKVAWRSDTEVVIRSGISQGDWVNTTPLANVVSGTKAQILGAEPEMNKGKGKRKPGGNGKGNGEGRKHPDGEKMRPGGDV